jgi:hypothetical protein
MMPRTVTTLLACAAVLSAQLQISQRQSPTNDYESALAVLPNGIGTITSQNASNTKLIGLDMWSSVSYKALIYTVSNGVQSTSPVAVGGAQGFASFQWRTPDPVYVTLGSSGGQDAYRVLATNLDQTNTADILVSFHYSTN